MKSIYTVMFSLLVMACTKDNSINEVSTINVRFEVMTSDSIVLNYASGEEYKLDTVVGSWSHEFTAYVPDGESRYYGCTYNFMAFEQTPHVQMKFFVNDLLRGEFERHLNVSPSPTTWHGSGVTIP
jgi:hypothetical protein